MLAQTQIYPGFSSRQLIPELVYFKETEYVTGTTTFAFTIDQAPIEGNLMVLCVGGSQSRTSTFPGGWTVHSMVGAGQTLDVGYKIAGSSETLSFNITFSANLQGSIFYFEFRNVDQIAPLGGTAAASTFTTATSKQHSVFDVGQPAVYIQDIQFTTAPTSIGINDGFTVGDGSDVNFRHGAAYRIFPGPTYSVGPTWTFSSATGSVGMISFIGRRI